MDALDRDTLGKTLLRVAWLSVLLGIGMEILLLLIAAFFDQSSPAQKIVADLVQKVSWSTFVCTGVAVGLAATKMRSPMMGLAGLIAAPVAFYVAKTLHKSAVQALSITEQAAASGPSPLMLALLKGVEYAALGFLLGHLSKKAAAGLKEHALAGLFIGVTFGGFIVYLMITIADTPLPLLGILTRCANEIIFPVGCSLVLFTAQKLGEKQSASETPEPSDK